MAFRSYSTMLDGVPTSDEAFSDKDTYLAVFPTSSGYGGNQKTSCEAIKTLFNVIYEGPLAFNHYHGERTKPSQFLIIFEKKCPQELSPVLDASKTEETPEATT